MHSTTSQFICFCICLFTSYKCIQSLEIILLKQRLIQLKLPNLINQLVAKIGHFQKSKTSHQQDAVPKLTQIPEERRKWVTGSRGRVTKLVQWLSDSTDFYNLRTDKIWRNSELSQRLSTLQYTSLSSPMTHKGSSKENVRRSGPLSPLRSMFTTHPSETQKAQMAPITVCRGAKPCQPETIQSPVVFCVFLCTPWWHTESLGGLCGLISSSLT